MGSSLLLTLAHPVSYPIHTPLKKSVSICFFILSMMLLIELCELWGRPLHLQFWNDYNCAIVWSCRENQG